MFKIFKFQGESQFMSWLFLSMLTGLPAVASADLSVGMRLCLIGGSFVGWYAVMILANALLGD
jgi:hypothetical protein